MASNKIASNCQSQENITTYGPIPLGTEQSPPERITISGLALTFDGGVEDPEPAPVEVVVDRRQVVHVENDRVRRRPRRVPDRRAAGDRPAHRPQQPLPRPAPPLTPRGDLSCTSPAGDRPTARAAAAGARGTSSARRDPEGRAMETEQREGRWMKTQSTRRRTERVGERVRNTFRWWGVGFTVVSLGCGAWVSGPDWQWDECAVCVDGR